MPETLMTQDHNNDNSKPTADWRDGLPEELREEPSLSLFKDVGSLAKSYVHAQKLRNEKGLIRPADDAPEEEWNVFYAAIGRPETPDKYEFSEASLPEGHEIDPEMEKSFREQAHKVGLTKSQAATLRDWYLKHSTDTISGFEALLKERRDQAETTLRKEWGAKFEENLDRARAALHQFVPPENMQETLTALDSGPGNDPALIKLFYNIAEAMTEDPLVGRRAALNSQTALEKALEITRHPAYIDGNHPEHRQKVKEAQELFSLAYPEMEK